MNRNSVRACAAFGAAAMAMALPAQAYASNKDEESVAKHVKVASANREGGRTMHAQRHGGAFRADVSDATVSIPASSNGKVVVSPTGQGAISLGLGESEAQRGLLASDGSVVYSGTDEIDQSVVAVDDGVRIHSVIQSSTAPAEIIHDVTLPDGARLVSAKDLAARDGDLDAKTRAGGAVYIVDAQGSMIGGFAAPWAEDARGKQIATRYEIRGTKLVQHVEHHGASTAYPVVADPYLGFNLVSSASWHWVNDSTYKGYSLHVVPTGWARANGGGYVPGAAGWDELYSKYKSRGLNTNLGGMRDQYICHAQFAFLKDTWNLDEARPDVSYAATVAAQCNPKQ